MLVQSQFSTLCMHRLQPMCFVDFPTSSALLPLLSQPLKRKYNFPLGGQF